MTIRFSSDPSFQKWLSPGVIVCRVCDCSRMMISRVFVSRDDCLQGICLQGLLFRNNYLQGICLQGWLSPGYLSPGMIVQEWLFSGYLSPGVIVKGWLSPGWMMADFFTENGNSFLYCVDLMRKINAGNGFILLKTHVYTKQSIHSTASTEFSCL